MSADKKDLENWAKFAELYKEKCKYPELAECMADEILNNPRAKAMLDRAIYGTANISMSSTVKDDSKLKAIDALEKEEDASVQKELDKIAKWRKRIEAEALIEPCKHCGRCVFVGPPCCQGMTDELAKIKKDLTCTKAVIL